MLGTLLTAKSHDVLS